MDYPGRSHSFERVAAVGLKCRLGHEPNRFNGRLLQAVVEFSSAEMGLAVASARTWIVEVLLQGAAVTNLYIRVPCHDLPCNGICVLLMTITVAV